MPLCLTLSYAYAQENQYVVAIDTTIQGQKKWAPSGVRLGADILTPILYSFDDTRSGAEFIADIDFNTFYLVGEFGFGGIQETGETASYNVDGTYFRAGPDANFISKDKALNSFALGLRYARSSFKETLSGSYDDQDWGLVEKDLSQGTLSSGWVEIAASLKVRLWKGLYTGYTLRFKFARSKPEQPVFETYYVPGYGFANRGNNWSFHYYLYYRISWRKKPIIWKP